MSPGATENASRQIAEGKQSDEIFRLVVETTPNALVLADASGRILLVNAGAEKLFGYPREELIGQPSERLLPERFRANEAGCRPTYLTEPYAPAMMKRRELFALRKDGSEVPVQIHLDRIETADGPLLLSVISDITEHKQTDEQLRASLKEIGDFKAALDEHAIVAVTDARGKITYVNDKFCEISKYSRDELLGQDHRIINSGYHPAEFIRDLWTTITHGRVWHGEIKNRAKDGSFYWVDTTIVPLLNEKGKTRQYVAIRADITQRKEIEEQLRTSLNEVNDLKAALDEHAIVAITDPQGRITYVNDKFCAISKYSREELLGQDHRIINSGFHSTEFIRDLWTTITRGKVWHGEIKNRAKDGSFYWVDTTIVPYLNSKGKPRQYVAIRADITERKRMEAQLRESLREINDLKTALDEHAIVAMTDPQGRITFVNDKFCQIAKYSREELLGQDHRIINSGYHPTEFIRDLWTTIANGKVWRGEIKNRAKDGSYYWVDTTIVPFLNESGKPRQYVAIRADISERKRAEEEIRQLNLELEERVVQRTADLELANKELEAFSYSVSHDLRAPLRAVDGFAQAVLEDFGPGLPELGRHYLHTVRDGAQKMGALIDDLLTFSRLSRLPLNRRSVDTARMVRDAIEELGFPPEGRQVEMRIGELPLCIGDSALLKQVWLNLLANALKYTGRRDVAVIEIGHRRAAGGDEDIFFIRDNGTGFDMRYADKLFGVFQRLHRADEFEGTGVGLAIVQRIVHRHGGRVWAEAVLDQGATFYFSLEGGPDHG